MTRNRQPVNLPVQAEPEVMKPTTVAEWRVRIGQLENDLTVAERSVVERRSERRTAAGAALVFGADAEVVADLEAAEREAERRVDSLKCAVELAHAELTKLEDQARLAKIEARRVRRSEAATEIKVEAAIVDRLYAELAVHLGNVAGLLGRYRSEGGEFRRSLRSCSARAALNAGLHDLVELGYVGGTRAHWVSLEQQLGSLAAVESGDEPLAAQQVVEGEL